MRKKGLSLLLAVLILTNAAYAAQTKQNSASLSAAPSPFYRSRPYTALFSDVPENAWFAPYVAALYECGLTEGQNDGRSYGPDEAVTVAEVLTFAARLRGQYEDHGETLEFFRSVSGFSAWYAPYVAYLQQAGVIGTEWNGRLTESATRAETAGILAAALPEEWYDNRNADLVTEGYALGLFVQDVTEYTPYQPQILWCYKQGILSGVDAHGSFLPEQSVTRAEVAAILTRMMDPSLRLALGWDVRPYVSAEGKTLASLAEDPASVTLSPDAADAEEIDALLRRMFARNQRSITLYYDHMLSYDEATDLTHSFLTTVKRYCEQLYNAVNCHVYSTGRVELTFSSSVCSDEELTAYRKETMALAIRAHDMLWESGALYRGMSEQEKAYVYYHWLCENCAYDSVDEGSNSTSHLAYRALKEGLAVCDGYTGAYNLLLKLEGIDCYACCNATHIWTVAVLDGMTCHIDTTWGDNVRYVDDFYFAMSEGTSYDLHPW